MANQMINFDIREIAKDHAENVIKSLAVAQRMGAISNEKDLQALIQAGIETALEDFSEKLTTTFNEDHESS